MYRQLPDDHDGTESINVNYYFQSQEREQNLRSQLQNASITMKQKNEKISEMEKTLLETSNKLREAEDSLKQRQVYTG